MAKKIPASKDAGYKTEAQNWGCQQNQIDPKFHKIQFQSARLCLKLPRRTADRKFGKDLADIMNIKKCTAILLALAVLLVCGWFNAKAQDSPIAMPLKSVPTFSTANIGRQGHFYVGGKWVGEAGKEFMRGAMYVEVWVPKDIRYKYPIVFVQSGGGQTNVALLQTPDGRPGWAYDFVNRGYTVYMLDLPARGRSGYVPGFDGEMAPPYTMYEFTPSTVPGCRVPHIWLRDGRCD